MRVLGAHVVLRGLDELVPGPRARASTAVSPFREACYEIDVCARRSCASHTSPRRPTVLGQAARDSRSRPPAPRGRPAAGTRSGTGGPRARRCVRASRRGRSPAAPLALLEARPPGGAERSTRVRRRTATATRACSSSRSKGLAMKSSAPSRKASSLMRWSASAPHTMIGASPPSAHNLGHSTSPSTSGRLRSSTIASGAARLSIALASAPFSACQTVQLCSAKAATVGSARLASSSTSSSVAPLRCSNNSGRADHTTNQPPYCPIAGATIGRSGRLCSPEPGSP